MLKDRVIELTLAVYRLTRLFPRGEVLIGQTRKTANQILESIILKDFKKAQKQIKVLLAYLCIAGRQQWTKQINFAILIREYQKILYDLKNRKKIKNFQQKKESQKSEKISSRQIKILKFIKKEKSIQIKDLTPLFPKLSSRTIRRDLNDLIEKNFLDKEGSGRKTHYLNIGQL